MQEFDIPIFKKIQEFLRFQKFNSQARPLHIMAKMRKHFVGTIEEHIICKPSEQGRKIANP